MKWISVDEELPEEDGLYLCHFTDKTIETFPYDQSECELIPWGVYGGNHSDHVTHWQPLPEPPKYIKGG